MGLFDAIKGKANDIKRNKEIKKQILNDRTINKDDVDFFFDKNNKTPEEYYCLKINKRDYKFKPTWVQDKVEVNVPRKQFKYGVVFNGEDIERVDFSFEEGTRTETVKTQDTVIETKSKFGLGRAAVGGALLGPAGILLGCTKKDKVIQKNKNGTSTVIIPTIKSKITVVFNNDKKPLDITLKETDQEQCEVLYKKADEIIKKLEEIKEIEQKEPRCFEESENYQDFKIEVL